MWAKAFDKDLSEVLVIQAEIAKAIAAELQAVLSPQEQKRIERLPTGNAKAYELYLMARGKPPAESIELLKRAIALDPQFALAYSALAWFYTHRSRQTGREDIDLALQTARQGVALDPQASQTHQVLATALLSSGREDEARLAFQRAIELDHNTHAGLNDLSVLETNSGHLDQALYWAKRAFQTAPNLANSYYHVGVPLQALDDAASERWLRAGAARFPVDHPTAGHRLQLMLAIGELRRGESAAALQRMRNAVAVLPRNAECQGMLTDLAVLTGAPDASDRIDQAMKRGPGARIGFSGYTTRTLRAFLWTKAGDRERALPLIDAALAQNRTAIEGGDRSSLPRYCGDPPKSGPLVMLVCGPRRSPDHERKTPRDGAKDPHFAGSRWRQEHRGS
ncbi:MAG: hypothetical protein EXS32_14410, partial [Opitutus sp.]|nr:hypothetical protein [Opitutus sp.]